MTASDSEDEIERRSATEMAGTVAGIKKMLVVGAVVAVVGYLLTLSALFFEVTEFHPLIENFFTTYTDTSLAGGGPQRDGAVNEALSSIHTWPSTLLWLKLGGIAHILLGIFISLVAIVRALALMPHRLAYELDRTEG